MTWLLFQKRGVLILTVRQRFVLSPQIFLGFIFISMSVASDLGDALFTPMSVFVPEDLKPFLTIDHVNMIRSSGIFF